MSQQLVIFDGFLQRPRNKDPSNKDQGAAPATPLEGPEGDADDCENLTEALGTGETAKIRVSHQRLRFGLTKRASG